MLDVRSSSEPSLVESIIRLIDAGHRLVLDRIDLVRYDLGELANRTLRGAALIGIGVVLLAGAWCALMTGAVLWLTPLLSLPGSVVVVALFTSVAGAGMVAVGIRRAQYAGKELVADAVSDALGKSVPATHANDGAARNHE
jgi:hypothetical protein